jgi:CRISPR system Cascade subunit CasD
MQSWGTTSRFDQRETGKEPSKSGVLGILAAALGIDRENWTDLEPLTRLAMAVRHDRAGIPRREYQTAGCAATDTIIKADGKPSTAGGVVSQRYYLADAAFLVALGSDDRVLLDRAHAALQNPVWPLALGRKSYIASEAIWMNNGMQDDSANHAVRRWPWIASPRRWEPTPERLLVSYESADNSGVLRMDQPLSSFSERRFGGRFIRSEWIPFPGQGENVAA